MYRHPHHYAPRHALMGRMGQPMVDLSNLPQGPMAPGYYAETGGEFPVFMPGPTQPPMPFPPNVAPPVPPGQYVVPNVQSCHNMLNYPAPNCTKARVLYLTFGDSSEIAATTTTTLTARPQKLFKPQRIVCPSFIAENFLLLSFKIGTQEQAVDASGNGVNLQVFSEVSQNTMVEFDTACLGSEISIQVRNFTASAQIFSLTLIGTTAE